MENLTMKEKLLPILSNKKVDMKKEMIGGLTTFLTMAYIIAVNPNILSTTGMPAGALVTSTCLAAGIACILMGVFANLPFALASGMGLNAYFAYTVVGQMGVSWEIALSAVFIEGIIFIILSLFKVREAVVNAIPKNMKLAVTGGIGLFIAFIGMVNAGLVVANESTMVELGHFSPAVIITVIGLIIIAVLDKKKVKGSILWGILISSLIAWGYALINTEAAAALGIYLPTGVFKFEGIGEIAGKVDLVHAFSPENIKMFITVIFTFLFVDFFDTAGTLVAVCNRANLVDETGNLENVDRALLADSIGTVIGSIAGTSTVTSFVESTSGVEVGGRTGLTAVTTGVCFLLSVFFSPLLSCVTSAVTAPALIIVGILMAQQLKGIEWDNIVYAASGFMTVIFMILAYSISNGIAIGFITYTVSMIGVGKIKEIKPIVWILDICFVIFLVFLPK